MSDASDPIGLPDVSNPPGRSRLKRRATDHARAMARMRAVLALPEPNPGHPHGPAVRALAHHGTDDPALALLDAWALVADTVAFYSERIAGEGLLRTATRASSVRELARTVGYELGPGVAAEVDLAFTAESGPLAPEVITVPEGTPVKSVPVEAASGGPVTPASLPQTFETSKPLQIRAAWNALPVLDEQPQSFPEGTTTHSLWLPGVVAARPGDLVLLTGNESSATSTVAEVDPTGRPGWTLLILADPVPSWTTAVHTFAHRARLFGWNAPDPSLLLIDGNHPPGSKQEGTASTGIAEKWVWEEFNVVNPLDLDGDYPDVAKDSLLLIEQGASRWPYRVYSVSRAGTAAFATSGLTTQTILRRLDGSEVTILKGVLRRQAVIHCASTEHDATKRPLGATYSGSTLAVPAFEPAFETGHRVLIAGRGVGGAVQVTSATITSCTTEDSTPDRTNLALDKLLDDFPTGGLVVYGNVVAATHGETVQQVLGSGDGTATFQTFPLRREPLTFLGTTGGAEPALTVRVDDVEWRRVGDLGDAGPHDRVYVLRLGEDGAALIGFGDGVHGARLPTGTENVAATYRIGLGEGGAVAADRITQLPRRPLGVREVTNPAPATGWDPPESPEQAKINAPRQVRTLDRAISLADHERIAAAFPGIGVARANLVWDGERQRVVVSVRTGDRTEPGDALLTRLHGALTAVRQPDVPLDVLAGEVLPFGLTVRVERDPAWPWQKVQDDIVTALMTAYGPWIIPFATPVRATPARYLIEQVPGVLRCTEPKLSLSPERTSDVLAALPARWGDRQPEPAQILVLSDVEGAIDVKEPKP